MPGRPQLVEAQPPPRQSAESAVPRAFRIPTLAATWDLSRQFLYREIKAQRLRAVRIGGALRVLEADAIDYLQRQAVEVGKGA